MNHETYNQHYIQIDQQKRIVDGWSDGPQPNHSTFGAICINEKGGYQFRLYPDGEENPPLFEENGIPLYKWEDEHVTPRTQEEMDADIAKIPVPINQNEVVLELLADHEERICMMEILGGM